MKIDLTNVVMLEDMEKEDLICEIHSLVTEIQHMEDHLDDLFRKHFALPIDVSALKDKN